MGPRLGKKNLLTFTISQWDQLAPSQPALPRSQASCGHLGAPTLGWDSPPTTGLLVHMAAAVLCRLALPKDPGICSSGARERRDGALGEKLRSQVKSHCCPWDKRGD